MKATLLAILKKAWGEKTPIELSIPDDPQFGHYATNVAMRIAHAHGKKPLDLAEELRESLVRKAPADFFERVEVAAPGFINFWLTDDTIRKALAEASRHESFGSNHANKGSLMMVEFTDPNPFKLFHIGHLMSNTIGESFARLCEASGARVRRANYYGDVGLHIAKSLWGMQELASEMPPGDVSPNIKMEFLGKAYALGSKAYEEREDAKGAITEINKKIYERSDGAVNTLYDMGLAWSLAYFETVYKRLGTKFDDYFPESSVSGEGMDLVRARKDIFIESDGAIVFPGEHYGLHTRVFINSQGLPTYEAKELGLNKRKFELYPLALSIIVTGNEVKDYFNVLLKTMELVLPEVAEKTKHMPHGMLRLPSGKMSSRTGDVITAEALLDNVKKELAARVSERSTLDEQDREAVTEAMAIGAIKYSILKQNPGQDIVFDFDTSLSFEGDSGPYLHYTYARLQSIVRKAENEFGAGHGGKNFSALDSAIELSLARKILDFPDVVSLAQERFAPSGVAAYLYRLAALANKFYETMPVLKEENKERREARLALASLAARTLRFGMSLLGITALEKI